jgi:hypothetical protein
VMPTSMRSMFIGVRMTLKPWNSALISVMNSSLVCWCALQPVQ